MARRRVQFPNIAFCILLFIVLFFDACKSSDIRNRSQVSTTDDQFNEAEALTKGAIVADQSNVDDDDYLDEDEGDLEFLPLPSPPKATPLTDAFCATWNPEYKFRKKHCCSTGRGRSRRVPRHCAPQRRSGSFCSEATNQQRSFSMAMLDALSLQELEQQAFCTPDNGFLARGIPLLETPQNRILVANPRRCANYGTTGLVLLLDRLGKAVHKQYESRQLFDGIRLVVGDMSAPRGGCLATRRGSHSGHTNGLDADVAFLKAKPGLRSSFLFHRDFDAPLNWWLLKTLEEESPVCLQYIFLDRRHIRSLQKVAGHDPSWKTIGPLLKHVSGHRNHFHFRVGTAPRQSGGPIRCVPSSQPQL